MQDDVDNAQNDVLTDEPTSDSAPDTAESQEESSGKGAPRWVKELRHQYRDVVKEKRALEVKVKALEEAQQASQRIEKPTLEACAYDVAKYEQLLIAWYEGSKPAKKEHDTRSDWDALQNKYRNSRSAISYEQYGEAEDEVSAILSPEQQNIILEAADNPARVIQLIHQNGLAPSLASIKSPISFAKRITIIEGSNKRAPEKILTGGTPTTNNDTILERLRQEAIKTGNASKLLEFKRQLKTSR